MKSASVCWALATSGLAWSSCCPTTPMPSRHVWVRAWPCGRSACAMWTRRAWSRSIDRCSPPTPTRSSTGTTSRSSASSSAATRTHGPCRCAPCATKNTWSPPTKRCSRCTAKRCSAPPRQTASTFTTRRPCVAACPSSALCARAWRRTRSRVSTASSTALRTSSCRRWQRRARRSPTCWRGPRKRATPRPIRPWTSAVATRRTSWRSWPCCVSARRSMSAIFTSRASNGSAPSTSNTPSASAT